MKNFFKGLLAGIFNITPGLSGSALLIIFNLYEKCLYYISNILKDFKTSFLYLFPIGSGILLGTYLFSNVIYYFINKYPLATSLVFLGFLFGTIPSLIKKATIKGFKESYLITFIISLTLGMILLIIKNNYIINLDTSYKTLLLVGIIISISTIIPGISSTVLLNLIGFYNTYLNAINTMNLKILIPILIGIIISFYLISKLLNYLLKNFYGYTYFFILGFFISTLPSLLQINIIFNQELIIGIILGIIFFYITKKIDK